MIREIICFSLVISIANAVYCYCNDPDEHFYKYFDDKCSSSYTKVGSSTWSYNITKDHSDKPTQINAYDLKQRFYFGDETKTFTSPKIVVMQHEHVTDKQQGTFFYNVKNCSTFQIDHKDGVVKKMDTARFYWYLGQTPNRITGKLKFIGLIRVN